MITTALLTMGGIALLMGIILSIAYLKLAVKPNPKEEAIRKLLPGANCGACGFPGCDMYAEKLSKGEASIDGCKAIGNEVREKIAEIIGVEVKPTKPMIATLICQGGRDICPEHFNYDGVDSCRAAVLLHGGDKGCPFGCIGLGDCERVCPFNAIRMGNNGLPIIDPDKCTGCGICVDECPKGVLKLIPKDKLVYLACNSQDRGKDVKSVCKLGCIGCTICIKVCPYDALRMEGNLPVMDFEKCTDCGICVHKCPTKSFVDRAPSRPYAIITPECDGCGECVKVCQFKAIEGESGKRHRVIRDRCIGCGECVKVCKPNAITMAGALAYQREAA